VLIRSATDTDLPALADLAARTFPLACPPGMPEQDIVAFVGEHLSRRRLAEHLANPDAGLLVADDEGSLVGYTLTFAVEPYGEHATVVRSRPSVELSKCYADPAAHGSGVATALMTAVLDRARRTGAASVWLGVNAQNERAQRFYAKHGFVRVGTRSFTVGEQLEDDLVLECPL